MVSSFEQKPLVNEFLDDAMGKSVNHLVEGSPMYAIS